MQDAATDAGTPATEPSTSSSSHDGGGDGPPADIGATTTLEVTVHASSSPDEPTQPTEPER